MPDFAAETRQLHRDKLVADLEAVIADAEAILHDTASQGGEKVSELRARIQERLTRAKAKLDEVQSGLVGRGKAAATATDDFVHGEPWKAVGIAALIGLAVGVLIGRR